MRFKGIVCTVLLSSTFVFCGPLMAGPDYIEPKDQDAGSLPDTARIVQFPNMGGKPLGSIFGVLTGATPLPSADFEDMYLLRLKFGEDFGSVFEALPSSSTTFPISLWLFTGPDHPKGPGLGIVGAECLNCPNGPPGLFQRPTDGVTTPEIIPDIDYYIAITGFGNVPFSDHGPIFSFSTLDEISGPDGPGGLSPITSWTGFGPAGVYKLDLGGTAFTPEPTAALLLLTGTALLARRRHG